MNKKKLIPQLRFPEFKNEGEWEVKSLGEVLIKNLTKNKKQKYSLVESVSNKFGFIKQDEYFENRRVASKDTSNYYVIKKGHFAYNPSRIDVGSLAYKHDDKTSIISPLYVSFKANKDLVDDYFLLNFFNSVGFTKQMIFEGGVRNTLNYENLIQIKIPIPKLIEQQKIASCLSSLDDLIAAHNQKLALLKDYKKGLMQNLFPQEGEKVPKLRFKEFEKDGEWKNSILSKVSDVIMGSSPSSKYYNENKIGLPLLQGNADIKNRLSAPRIYTTEITKECEVGDILLSVRAPVGTVAKSIHNACIGRGISALRAKKTNSQEYLYQWLFSYESSWGKISQGGTFDAVNSDDVRKLLVPFPSPKEQQKIASCLSALDELITEQAKKIEQLKQHKKGLMQRLFPKND